MAETTLLSVLADAYAPCPNFRKMCSACRWEPSQGFIPRGFGGARGGLGNVRLVLITDQPANPADGESYSGGPEEMFKTHWSFFNTVIEENSLRRDGREPPFHRNLRKILENCWPGEPLKRQLEKTWFTNSVLCSLPPGKNDFGPGVAGICVDSYLKGQLELFPNAFVATLGGRARKRLKNYRVDGHAQSPSARASTSPEFSWEKLGESFQVWLDRRSGFC